MKDKVPFLTMTPSRRLLTAILLASVGTLVLLTGATWYSTPRLRPAQADLHSSMNRRLPSDRQFHLPPSTFHLPPSSLALFLDIVPSLDGTELFISAGGVGELSGRVFANVGIGPGSHERSYTMVYSDTVQSYIGTAVGFTPGMNASAPLNITTTTGLDTGAVEFNRAYVPASTTQIIRSTDGNLELRLVSADTITYDTYVAVVPSFAPPGPAPLGHRLIGSTYSVRAAGALLETDRPMNLRLYYNETLLGGPDPHTLAIFAWDAAHRRWDRLGGRLFSDWRYLSVATCRFTTYALMTTSVWHDDFDDFSGLDAAEFNNVTLGGTLEDGALVLATTPGSGTAISRPIMPTMPIDSWGRLTFAGRVDPPTTTLRVDVLGADGAQLLAGVASGASLDRIDPAEHPSLRLRVTLSSTAAGETPALTAWDLRWRVGKRLYLPLIGRR
ncbi:MAG: hypothetical protein ACE5F6_01030 [Anaerolineae bacterium]